IHVNGDDPEACIRALQIAFEYRQRFHKDVVIDILCYRKHGHNEGDDPSYTQPVVYKKVREHKPVADIYAERLKREATVTTNQVNDWLEEQKKYLYEIYDQVQAHKFEYALQEVVPAAPVPADLPPTGVDGAMIERIIHGITTFPADFHVHPKL